MYNTLIYIFFQILQTDYVEKCKPKPKPAYNPYKPQNGDEEEEEEEDSQANMTVSHIFFFKVY